VNRCNVILLGGKDREHKLNNTQPVNDVTQSANCVTRRKDIRVSFAPLVNIRKDSGLQLQDFSFCFCKKITNKHIMKRLFVATGFLFLFGFAIGQATDGTSELQKTATSQPAALIYLPYSPEVVQKSLANYLSKNSEKQQLNASGYLLSSNTLIARNNKNGADMHFAIGLKNDSNENETAIYLKLNSFSNGENSSGQAIQFDMQDAKDYLDNLAIAIKPYASNLQLKLQQKNLSDSQDKNMSLIAQGKKLEEERKKIEVQIGENKSAKKEKGLVERKIKNEKLIDENLTALLNLSDDIAKQIAALALLTN
jgi:hypothetical protein